MSLVYQESAEKVASCAQTLSGQTIYRPNQVTVCKIREMKQTIGYLQCLDGGVLKFLSLYRRRADLVFSGSFARP